MTPQTQVAPRPRATLTNDASYDEVAAVIVGEAFKRRYTRDETVAVLATAIQESGLTPTGWGDGGRVYGIYQQDGSYTGRSYLLYQGRSHPDQQIRDFFNRLDKKRASRGASKDIWENIFWLQQRPKDPSFKVAWSSAAPLGREDGWRNGGRQAYLDEIRSHESEARKLVEEARAIIAQDPELVQLNPGFVGGSTVSQKRPTANADDGSSISRRRPVTSEPSALSPPSGPVVLLRPPASYLLNCLISNTEQAFNAALDGLRGKNPTRAPECQPGQPSAVLQAVQAVGAAVKKYRSARQGIDEELSRLRDQKMNVDRYTAEVVPIANKAVGQVFAEANWLNDAVLRDHAWWAADARRRNERANEQPVLDALEVSAKSLETILTDARKAVQKLASKIAKETAGTPRGW